MTSTAPLSTVAPTAATMSVTVPSLGARSSFSIFIASIDHHTLACGDAIADGHEHADDATGHGGLDGDRGNHSGSAFSPARTKKTPGVISMPIPPPRMSVQRFPPQPPRCRGGAMRISHATPPSIIDSVSASIHERSNTRLLPSIVTVTCPGYASGGSTSTVRGRPFTVTSTFIAAIPAARAAPRAKTESGESRSRPRLRRTIFHKAAAIAAVSSIRSSLAAVPPFCSSSRSTYVVSNSADANAGDRTTSRQNPIVVLMPRTSYSINARTIRRMAPGRSGAHAMSFDTSGSYAVGTAQPSYAPLSSRIPGPDGARRCVISPGDGRNPSAGFSA